jgi:homoaconitase
MTPPKSRVADLARQAKAAGLTAKVGLFSDQYWWITDLTKIPFLCTPGSEQIRATIERDNITEALTVTFIPRMEMLTSLNRY